MDKMLASAREHVEKAAEELLELAKLNASRSIFKDHVVDAWLESASMLISVVRKLK